MDSYWVVSKPKKHVVLDEKERIRRFVMQIIKNSWGKNCLGIQLI
jgi:hypothetical protein